MMQTYWLGDPEPKKVISKMNSFHGEILIWGASPLINQWVRNYGSYYSTILEPTTWESALTYLGEKGELVRMVVPQARQLQRHMVSIVTKQKLDFQAIANVTSENSIASLKIGNAVANYVVNDCKLHQKSKLMVEMGLVMGESFLCERWRTDKGEPIQSNGQSMLYKGKHEISVHSILDVFYDTQIENFEDLSWLEIRVKRNRWDLIAQHPELQDRILQVQTARDMMGLQNPATRSRSEDLIWVYELYCAPGPALPDGRLLIYADERCVFYDGPNLYGEIPVVQFKPSSVFGCGSGYAQFSDLLPAQEMLDHSFSAISTNQSAFAVQNVMTPRNSNISVEEIMGMNFIFYSPQTVDGGGKPEPLQLTQSSPETFKFIDLLQKHMYDISQINSVLRGDLPANLSGVAIATLTANALEFVNDTAAHYQETLEGIVSKSIRTYNRFAGPQHNIQTKGPNSQGKTTTFSGDDLEGINEIKMIIQNPLMQTIAGRADMADKLIASGLIKNPQEYISILEGRAPQSLYKTELSEDDLIDIENERLLKGEQVFLLGAIDDHPRHVREHSGLLNDMSVRENPQLNQMIMQHIIAHYQAARIQDPGLMAMVRTGQMPQIPQIPQIPPTPSGPPSPDQLGPTMLGIDNNAPPKNAPATIMGPDAQSANPAHDLLGRPGNPGPAPQGAI